MQTEPEQWAVELARDWDIECRHCSEYEGDWQADFAAAIQRAFEDQTRKLREANQRLRNGYADAVSGYNYIIANHGRLSGVGFDRVQDHFFEWVTMPEREGLIAGSHDLARQALKETPDAQ